MDVIFSFILLLIYPASAVYFAVITKKLFKVSKRKLIPVFLTAPSIVGLISMFYLAGIADIRFRLSQPVYAAGPYHFRRGHCAQYYIHE